MNLIIPAAGKSTRFPDMRPKWMLAHPNGNLMLAEAIRGIKCDHLEKIFLVVLKSHMDEYDCREGLHKQFEKLGLGDKLTIIELPEPTNSQPETVFKAIEIGNISGPIMIKDSDNFFDIEVKSGNFVSVVDLNEISLVNPRNKSYAAVNDHGNITNIAEKRVISNFFCAGAYGFEDAKDFCSFFEKLSHHNDFYISHIIYDMILNDHAFSAIRCQNYADWGTLKDWNRFKANFCTLFVDLDGTLVENSGEHFSPLWGTTPAIEENVLTINKLFDSDRVQVIITTSRTEEFSEATERQLKSLGIKHHRIIYGLFHGKRIVINDYARTNPFRSCDAVNIARNSRDLSQMLEAIINMPD